MNRLFPFSLKDSHTALLSWSLSLVCVYLTAKTGSMSRVSSQSLELFDDAFQLGILALSLF
jgi:hypothetical protein